MGNNILKFVWKINNTAIEEEFDLSNYEDVLNERGTIAEEISLACMVSVMSNKNDNRFNFPPTDILKQYRDNDLNGFLKGLKEHIDSTYLVDDTRSTYNIAANFEVLEIIVRTFVHSACSSGQVTVYDNRSPIMSAINRIFEYTTQNKKLNTEDGEAISEFQALINEINKQNSKFRGYFLKPEKGKCIALYVGEDNKKTVAFSGHWDINNRCTRLKAFFGISDEKATFFEKYKIIAKSIGAKLATTNSEISRYVFVDKHLDNIVRYDKLGQIMRMSKTMIGKDFYSCCERKIIEKIKVKNGKDKEIVCGGTLYVKYAPCCECALATLYHIINKNQQFQMYVGMP